MLSNYCRDLGDALLQKLNLYLARLGAQTWMMNIFGIVSIVGSVYFLIKYKVIIALILLCINHVFDYMDSGIDRARRDFGKHSFRYRRIFHITTDKLSEIIFFSGLALGGYVYWKHALLAISTCLAITIVGRWVNYKRVFDLNQSLFDRADRLFVLLGFIWTGYNILGTVLISLMNIAGIIQRLIALLRVKTPKII